MAAASHDPSEASYHRYRTCSRADLWEREMPGYLRLDAPERLARVGLVRAVGVVFATHGSVEEKVRVRRWLVDLLDDPAEKIRRYAIQALPKLGSGPEEETALLRLLDRSASDRETRALQSALEKIGGRATLEKMEGGGSLPASRRVRLEANTVRREQPGSVVLDAALQDIRGLRIHLRGRRGLEAFVREEVETHPELAGRFQIVAVDRGLVALRPRAAFALGDLLRLRCTGTVGFVLGLVREPEGSANHEAVAESIASPLARRALAAFHRGTPRYRLEFPGRKINADTVREIAARAYARHPGLLNDSHQSPWAVDVHRTKFGDSVELRPRLVPDPRFAYRVADVAAASHPPLAACLARWAGRSGAPERVWDPFCGSGLELIESALLGGVKELHGTDLDPDALAAARANLAATAVHGVSASFTCCDFREHATRAGIRNGSLSLVVSNPPLGRRVRIPNLRGLIEDLFRAAAAVLEPGGRLVFTNPVRVDCPVPSLQLESRIMADLGGFDCRLEKWIKI